MPRVASRFTRCLLELNLSYKHSVPGDGMSLRGWPAGAEFVTKVEPSPVWAAKCPQIDRPFRCWELRSVDLTLTSGENVR
jgi:hypothetical protein